MAKEIIVRYEGETSSFDFTKVDREKLYGRKERLVVDERGATCSAAYLTSDGEALVPSGGTAFLYVDPRFETIERSELKAVDPAGNALASVPSTLGAEQTLAGPVDPQRVLDHAVTSVYELLPVTLGARLADALESGKIFETRFNYREGYDDAPAFLLKGEGGLFALVASNVEFDFIGRATEVTGDGDADAEDDELDFSMM